MGAMIVKRLLRGALTVALVTVLIFIVLRVVPGDPVSMLAGEDASEEHIQSIITKWGLDKPILEQFTIYIKSLLSGDAGMSFQYATATGQMIWSVKDLVIKRIPYTIILATAAICINIFISIPLGVLLALKPGSLLDDSVNAINYVIISLPTFFIGILLMYVFAIWLKWLPSGGEGGLRHLILPALTLSSHFSVTIMRMTRTEVGRTLSSDYVRMCRAKGLGRLNVLFVHSLRNVAIPVITLVGLRFGGMMAGAVFVERLFLWPGIGDLLISSVQGRDYPTVQFLVPYAALLFTLINTVVDILYGVLDPRVYRKS